MLIKKARSIMTGLSFALPAGNRHGSGRAFEEWGFIPFS
jgi:hypothetical protein